MDKSEKYDIKEASNPSLKPSARKNYANNAEAIAKGVKQTAKQRAKLPAKVVAAIAAKKGAPKQIKPKRPGVKKIKAPKTGKAPGGAIKRAGKTFEQMKKDRDERKKRNRPEKTVGSEGKTGDGSKVGNKPMKKKRKDTGSPKMKGPYMESNAQEKKNLLTVQSWMSKFSQSRM